MRNSKSLKINQRLSCTAFELSVGQIIGLFFVARDFIFPADQEKFNALVRERIFNDAGFVAFSDAARVEKLTSIERQAVENFFYQVNADLFIPKADDENDSDFSAGESFSGEDSYQDFIRLVWLNPQLVDYPYSVLKVMSENSAQWQEELKDAE